MNTRDARAALESLAHPNACAFRGIDRDRVVNAIAAWPEASPVKSPAGAAALAILIAGHMTDEERAVMEAPHARSR